MKREDKYSVKIKNIDQLNTLLAENQILNIQSMVHVKGGLSEGEGDGGTSVIIIPK
jgi:hypothetical protein